MNRVETVIAMQKQNYISVYDVMNKLKISNVAASRAIQKAVEKVNGTPGMHIDRKKVPGMMLYKAVEYTDLWAVALGRRAI